jgi:hypothetical protein
MNRLTSTLVIFLILFPAGQPSCVAEPETFRTKSAVIYYDRDKDLTDFIWRIGGQTVELPRDRALATSRVDRLIERVQAILDMQPKNFKVKIYLAGELLGPNRVAYYQYRTKEIHVSVHLVTDGVLAHEIAHAVIDRYFATPPSSKVQEILTQYVDRHLWSDY